MNIIITIVIGFLAGALAKAILPGKDPGGLIITTLLGIGGAFVGGYVSRLLGIGLHGGLMSFAGAVGGAVLILLLYRMIKGKS